MERLPDEILSAIFAYLSAGEVAAGPMCVCRRWRGVARRRVLSVRDVSDVRGVSDVSGVRALLVRGPATGALGALLTPQLRELTVGAGAPLGAAALASLARLPALRHLDVFTAARRASALALALAAPAAPAAPARLASLVLNDHVDKGFLSRLAEDTRLAAFHMYGYSQYYPEDELRRFLIVNRERLCELTLRCSDLFDKDYQQIGECVNLTSLQLYSCWRLRGAAALYLTRPPRLRRLHLTGTHLLRRSMLRDLLNCLQPKLTELVLSSSHFQDEHAEILAKRILQLQLLELCRCRISSGQVMVDLAAALPALVQLDCDVELSDKHMEELLIRSRVERLRCLWARFDKALYERIMYTQTAEHKAQLLAAQTWAHAEDVAALQYAAQQPLCVEAAGAFLYVLAPSRPPLRVQSAAARYAGRYFRDHGEGYRGELFYFSMRDCPIKPLPYDPALDDNIHTYKQPYYSSDSDDNC